MCNSSKSNKVKIKIIYTLRKALEEHNIHFNDTFTLSKGFKILNTLNLLNRDSLSARLVPLFQSKTGVFKKAKPIFAFGKFKTQLFYKSCVLNF